MLSMRDFSKVRRRNSEEINFMFQTEIYNIRDKKYQKEWTRSLGRAKQGSSRMKTKLMESLHGSTMRQTVRTTMSRASHTHRERPSNFIHKEVAVTKERAPQTEKDVQR